MNLTLPAGVLAAVLATAVLTPTPASAATVGGGIRTWTPLSENSGDLATVSRDQALNLARSFDVITAHRATFTGHVEAMKAANPNLKILIYTNAMFAQAGQGETFPADYYSYDALGNKVRTKAYGNYMMNPRSLDSATGASWAHERFRQCRNAVVATGYDGCFLDVLGTAPLRKGYSTSQPVDPATGKPWTDNAYLAATSALAGRIRSLLEQYGHGNALVYGNGLGSGPRFYAGASQLMPSLDGGVVEGWMRSGSESLNVWPSEAAWKQNVDMLSAGDMFVTFKTFGTSTQALRDQWHGYTLASFLLGAGPADGYSLIARATQVSYTTAHPWWSSRMGTPVGAYAKTAGGSYVRNFSGGTFSKAVVNPTGVTTTLRLGAKYCGLSGFAGTVLKMPPHTGQVLRRC